MKKVLFTSFTIELLIEDSKAKIDMLVQMFRLEENNGRL